MLTLRRRKYPSRRAGPIGTNHVVGPSVSRVTGRAFLEVTLRTARFQIHSVSARCSRPPASSVPGPGPGRHCQPYRVRSSGVFELRHVRMTSMAAQASGRATQKPFFGPGAERSAARGWGLSGGLRRRGPGMVFIPCW